MGRLDKQAIAKLSAELSQLDRERLRGETEALTEAEGLFVEHADRRGKHCYRSGWPDFLVEDVETGGFVFVEVKTGGDHISESQARMFEALERFGVDVRVWDPRSPGALAPWRKYLPNGVRSRKRPRNVRGPNGLFSARARGMRNR